MRPFDPKFARAIVPVRRVMSVVATLSLVSSVALAVQAIWLARFIAETFIDRSSVATGHLVVVAVAWAIRTVASSAQEAYAKDSGLKAVADTRLLTIEKISRIPTRLLPTSLGALNTLLTTGLNGIEIYVARYLPQLVITVIVPATLGAVVFWLDPLSAIVIFITIPLIPLFMTLVGWFTGDNVKRHWQEVTRLSARILDLMNGLPELKIFNRAKQQAEVIKRLSDSQKDATMKVLRLSFLSAFVLELLATISVALVAVAIGLRLVNGEMELAKGLAALILAPEIFLPLRMLGVHFHAAVEGIEAWEQVKEVIEVSEPKRGSRQLYDIQKIDWNDVSIQFPETLIQVPDGVLSRGDIVVLKGPSGCGKSTFLEALAGFLEPTKSEIFAHTSKGSQNIFDFSLSSWREHCAYVPQTSPLTSGTVREVLLLGNQQKFTDEMLVKHLENLGLNLDLSQQITDRNQGISIGQRHRLALLRAILRNPSFLFIDEPDAALDELSETLLRNAIIKNSQSGTGVLIVTHSQVFDDVASHIMEFASVHS